MEWINIEKKGLPGKLGKYLCYSWDGNISVESYDVIGKIIYCDHSDNGYATHATHYMELPAPPEDSSVPDI